MRNRDAQISTSPEKRQKPNFTLAIGIFFAALFWSGLGYLVTRTAEIALGVWVLAFSLLWLAVGLCNAGD